MKTDLWVPRRTFYPLMVGCSWNRWVRDPYEDYLFPTGELWVSVHFGLLGAILSLEFNPPRNWRRIVNYNRQSIRGKV